MDFYFPIAEHVISLPLLLIASGCVGFVSGLFGLGGGFLMTPILMFLGVPSSVAVATGSAQLVASSSSGALSARQQGTINFRLAVVLLIGAMIGTAAGIWFFNLMGRSGLLEPVITGTYIVLLGGIGLSMLRESIVALRKKSSGTNLQHGPLQHWFASLPFRYEFTELNVVISLVPLLGTATLIGFIGAVLGVGGGFMMVPALIYIFRVPARIVVGTSQFQILFTMIAATLMHAALNHSVDLLMAVPLIIGAVIGAQFGVLAGKKIQGPAFRLALAVLILAVALRFAGMVIGDLIGMNPVAPVEIAPAGTPVLPWVHWVAEQAASQGFLYGLATVLLALAAGWLGTIRLKRH